ncbi:Uncharacterised protein [Mycobacterium tuberculosis]|nr:hypothetical protein MRGA423_19260 [Mycobacterium tuberculosis RGTB423]CKO22076.1 Uncharacterised protein [Mycobacterium tuberculosis]
MVIIANWRVPTMVKQPKKKNTAAAATAAIVTVLARLRVVSSEGSRQNNAATPATITHITTNTICHVIPGLLCWVGEYAGQVREEYCAADTSAGLVVALQGERW